MCGIVAYIGHRHAHSVVLKGLKRLEYRGYDSAGLALMNGSLSVYKKQGKVLDLENYLHKVGQDKLHASLGIGHTRWATHGEPNDVNAHPHYSGNRELAIIHNGIIENYDALRTELISKGHQFESETDTEVLIHFIEDIKEHEDLSLEEAVRVALTRVIGAYAICVVSAAEPNTLIAARKGSPLVLGLGKGEFFLASDATPIVEYTSDVVYLNDNEVCVIKNGTFTIKDIHTELETAPYIQTLDIELEAIEKGGFEHFMLKEIYEQPKSISDCMRGRLNAETSTMMLGGIREYIDNMVDANRIIIIGCGTSWHAGLVAEYIFEDLCRIPVEVEYASEFRYRNPVINPGDVVIAISQSGETADTLAAIELAKDQGAIVLGVCNVVGSSIARASHAGSYTHAGPEIGVASTKAFTAQLTVLTMFAILVGRKKGTLDEAFYQMLLQEMDQIPEKVEKALKLNAHIKYISEVYKDVSNAIYLGRGHNFPVALEGALKLKEISYIHAEGYPAAEMKHGPIALIDKEMPIVVVATQDSSYEKVVSNIQEVKARKGQVIAVVTEGDTLIANMADHVLEIPATNQLLTPLVSVIPLQLLSYHIAVLRGCNVDQPRNLAKSVTVE
ncbi:MAG: glutamine--fructose-6-phosphate transaminase (isomerizing) [Tunicatimonas sp.]|uniref:glutamine--fructose-6-phosphate transaminase (isomerizing) n=1 Tax=Tunicatimonas sp. TaxID=1940096 RepID=UPI003C7381B9